MGRALASEGRRQKIFLMTKNCERDYAGSLKNLEDSLRRLRTDYVDLWQFHELVYDNDPDWVFKKGGLKAALEARRQGKVRYIGFTGHKDPRIHLKMLEKPFDWDTAQMPINVMDAHYRSFQNEVVPVCLQRNVGVLGMKSLGGGFPRGTITGTTDLAAEECIRYALSLPISSLVVGITSQQDLKQDLAIARDFRPPQLIGDGRLGGPRQALGRRWPLRAIQVDSELRRPSPSSATRLCYRPEWNLNCSGLAEMAGIPLWQFPLGSVCGASNPGKTEGFLKPVCAC